MQQRRGRRKIEREEESKIRASSFQVLLQINCQNCSHFFMYTQVCGETLPPSQHWLITCKQFRRER